MGDAAVRVESLGKRYQIGVRPSSGAMYDRLGRIVSRAGRPKVAHPTIWALRDVSFEVAPGTVMGVLGRNGSGKSTLMKILARVTVPTEGMAETRGRVGALLQVGAGFHPELSGRDNIALSGAILGMRRAEIAAVQDQIIDFAGIGAYLDTAVKFYSSGMYMRLAFSVSAHLAAEIMLVDEVLAVGDALFQKKCHDRILKLVGEGRTILFVSHSMESVRQLCDRAIVLDQGTVGFDGMTEEGITFYQERILGTPAPATPVPMPDVATTAHR